MFVASSNSKCETFVCAVQSQTLFSISSEMVDYLCQTYNMANKVVAVSQRII